MNFSSVIPKKGNRGGSRVSRDTENEIAYTVTRNTKKGVEYANFIVGVKLLEEVRYIAGDKVDIQRSDCGKFGLIKRVSEGGRSLSGAKQISRTTMRISIKKTKVFPDTKKLLVLTNVSASEIGLLFDWPAAVNQNQEDLPLEANR